MMGTMTDQELLRSAQQGHEVSFVLIYEQHREAIFRFTYRMLGSVEAAEDVTHDCFLSLLNGAQRFDPARASLRNYIYGVARNLSLKYLHNSYKLQPFEEAEEGTLPPSPIGPLTVLLRKELSRQIGDAISSLPPLQREALILFEFEDLCLTEIASIVEADVGTVKSRLHRARARLRRALALYLTSAFEKAPMETN